MLVYQVRLNSLNLLKSAPDRLLGRLTHADQQFLSRARSSLSVNSTPSDGGPRWRESQLVETRANGGRLPLKDHSDGRDALAVHEQV